jgi:predicted acetyltransferase
MIWKYDPDDVSARGINSVVMGIGITPIRYGCGSSYVYAVRVYRLPCENIDLLSFENKVLFTRENLLEFSMKEIRRIHKDEYSLVERIDTIVYNQRHDFSKEKDGEDKSLNNPSEWIWAVFENGKMMSCLNEIPFLMRFDGQSVNMSGIGGVGSLPEARKGGNIKALFETLIPLAYENGVLFSSLTPFSHVFYRKFGYELSCACNEIRIPTSEFATLKTDGAFYPVFSGDDTSALQAIHHSYIADINHGICRDYWPDNRAWRVFTRDDPYSTGTFLYVWHDNAGVPRSYIKYQDQSAADGSHNMSVRELVFTDREALYGALSIVSGLAAQFETFIWLMPTFLDPTDFVKNLWDIKQWIIPHDMTRVVNVKAALESMRRPTGEGSYVLEVRGDAQISANNGRYLVEYGPEVTHVTSTTRSPDICCDIPALSQLVTGYRSLENALRGKQTGVEVYGKRQTLSQVFTPRPQHVTEYF